MFSQAKEEEAVKKTIRQGVGDFRFINILQLFSTGNSCFYLFIFSITLLYHLFLYFFLPTTFSYTPVNDVRETSAEIPY